MGIKNFNKLLKFALAKDSSIVSSMKTINSSPFPTRIAIDMSGFIYRFFSNKNKHEYLRRFFYFFNNLILNNVLPIAVFDGKPPPSKNKTMEKRQIIRNAKKNNIERIENEIKNAKTAMEKQTLKNKLDKAYSGCILLDSSVFSNVKEMCEIYNIPVVNSPHESDAMIAYLHENKIIDGVISDDYDMFAYGIDVIYRKYDPIHGVFDRYDNVRLKKTLNISQTELTQICVLSGCDYQTQKNTDILKSYQTLIGELKHLTFEQVLKQLFDIEGENSDKYGHHTAFKEFGKSVAEISYSIDELRKWKLDVSKIDFTRLSEKLCSMCNFRKSTVENWKEKMCSDKKIIHIYDVIQHHFPNESFKNMENDFHKTIIKRNCVLHCVIYDDGGKKKIAVRFKKNTANRIAKCLDEHGKNYTQHRIVVKTFDANIEKTWRSCM